jgi:hypothetical protein
VSAVPGALINDPWSLYYKELFAGSPIGLLANSALKKARQANLERHVRFPTMRRHRDQPPSRWPAVGIPCAERPGFKLRCPSVFSARRFQFCRDKGVISQ